jgi:mono/diheme cytochrome c family protein
MSVRVLDLPALWLAAAGSALAAPGAAYPEGIRPLLEKHCFECHGEKTQKAGVRLDGIEDFRAADVTLWTKVHEAVASREMPPEDEPQLAEEEVARLLAWIEDEQRGAEPPRTRRMNRRELAAALRDVTGLGVDYAGGLPEDGKVAGFDTGADGLQDAADSIEQVMAVTRRAVDAIRFLSPPPGEPVVMDFGSESFKDFRRGLNAYKEMNIFSKGSTVTWLGEQGILLAPTWINDRDSFALDVPPPRKRQGVLRVAIVAAAGEAPAGVPNPRLAVRIGGRDFEPLEIIPGDPPRRIEFEIQVEDHILSNSGITVSLRNRIEMPYEVEGFENEDRTKPEDKIPGGGGLYRPLFDRKELAPDQRPVPMLLIRRLEVESDHVAKWPPDHWQVETGPLGEGGESARRLLALWVERAWRRPVQSAELEPFQAFFAQLRGEGMGFEDALRATFQTVLMSGQFRFLAALSDEDPVISQHGIATRLSFMLTGGPPDGELRMLAAAGKLRDGGVLDAQVDRLLADRRSEGFFEPFVVQWLNMDQPITLVMDSLQQVDHLFGRYLKQSLRGETVEYFKQVLLENRSARELVMSDWTMMNDSAARHYGYSGIEGGHFRRVRLRDDDPRGGGIIGHAGIQSMLTWMGENWVIYRGVWALHHILDMPPPPAPLEVPELNPSASDNRGKSFRELLRQHQEDPNCAICHKHMDPMGFAFQNFDPAGRWREVEYARYIRNELDGKIEWRGEGETRPVDSKGRLPRGEEFSSFGECKQLIAAHYMEDVLGGLLKNLLLHGTGRQADVDDLAVIRSIVKDLAPDQHPLRDALKALVRSRAFLDR